MSKLSFDPSDTLSSADEANSVVMNIKDMITCAGGRAGQTFMNPCGAEDTFDNDDFDQDESFYSEASSEISGLEPFRLPSRVAIVKRKLPLPSSDSLFAGLESPSIGCISQISSLDNIRDTVYDTILSKESTKSENSAIKDGHDIKLASSSSRQGDFTESLDKCVAVMEDKQQPIGSNMAIINRHGRGISTTAGSEGQRKSILVTRSGDSGVSVSSDKLGRSSSVDLTDDICEDGATPSSEEDGVLQGDTRGLSQANSTGRRKHPWWPSPRQKVDNAFPMVSDHPKSTEQALRGEDGRDVEDSRSKSTGATGLRYAFSAFSSKDGSEGRNMSNESHTSEPAAGRLCEIPNLESTASTISPMSTTDPEGMVAVEVEHIGSWSSQQFRELKNTISAGDLGCRTVESRSIIGKRNDHAETIETGLQGECLCKRKRYWACALLLAVIVLIVAISSGVAANNASSLASFKAGTVFGGEPSSIPSTSSSPSRIPSLTPSYTPSDIPSEVTSETPTSLPSKKPSLHPSITPTKSPSTSPSHLASENPSRPPSERPSIHRSSSPSISPSYTRSASPSSKPSRILSSPPSQEVSEAPSRLPYTKSPLYPSTAPTKAPTLRPPTAPTKLPTRLPSSVASAILSRPPSKRPSIRLTSSPTSLATAPASSAIEAFAKTLYLDLPSSPDHPLHRALQWAMEQGHPPSRQRIALAAFYYGTGGEKWREQLSFLSDDDECTWNAAYGEAIKGVSCSDEGDVAVVSLFDNGLSGEIPKALRMLTQMNMLWLNRNAIGGTLPSELEALTSLARLDLSNNAISGAIPSEIGNLQQLQEINMSVNLLSGQVPSELSTLPLLTNLWLDRNVLTGSVAAVCAAQSGILLSADCDDVDCSCCAVCCDANGVCEGSR